VPHFDARRRLVRKLFVLVLATLCALPVPAVDVAEEELRGASPIEFVNFEGVRLRRHTPEDIRGIGLFLAEELETGNTEPRYARRYSLLHLYDEAQSDRLGADIISIERAARVDHIATIRYLLSGYLQRYYGYSRENADLLALFTTYYNAVHRGDMAYFGSMYQSVVVDALAADRAGLAVRYDEWAGRTQILIPLTDRAARRQPGALDTSALTDRAVTEELQRREDRGVEERREMIELKEEETAVQDREVVEREQALEQRREELAAAEEQLARDRSAAEEEQRRIERERDQAARIADAEQRERREQEIARREEELQREQEEQDRRAREIEQQQEEVSREEQAVAEERREVTERQEEIAREQREVARDERIVEAQERPEEVVEQLEQAEAELARQGEPVAANKLYYMKVNRYLTDGHYANDLYAINVLTGEVLYKAPEKPHIAGHNYTVIDAAGSQGVLVLTHSGDYREAHYLTLLDLETLEAVRTGDRSIFHRSFIEKRGDFLYAVNYDARESTYRLGKYDLELNLVAESAELIDGNTIFHMFGDFVYVNSPAGKAFVLRASDLSKTGELELN
jgi:hypothetical protein